MMSKAKCTCGSLLPIAVSLLLIGVAALSTTGEPLTRAGGYMGHGPTNGPQPGPHGGFQPMNRSYGPEYIPARIRVQLTRHISDLSQENVLKAPEVSYYGVLGLGSPAKMFNVVFDTGSNEVWIPYYNWFPLANNLHYSTGFSCKDSSTCVHLDKKFTADYRFTRLSGSIYEDKFSLFEDMQKDDLAPIMPGAQLSFGQNFLAVDDASDEQFRWKPYDGSIGLAPVTQSSSGIRNILLSIQYTRQLYRDQMTASGQGQYPIQQQQQYQPYQWNQQNYGPLQQQEMVSDLVFAIWFNPGQHSRFGGEIMFGGIDENRYVGDIFFHRINSWFEWQLPVGHVMLGSQVISCSYGCNAVLDTGANSLVGPRPDVERIYQELQAEYNRGADLWLVDCNQIESYPMLEFRFNDTPYKLYPSSYIKMFRFRDQVYCHLAIKPWDKPNWLLGTTFIGAYYTIFDFAARRIGFATPH